ncbi:MAG TPA: hypothetical protein VGJ28_06535 [Micromonosporaceae bacterium]
MLSRTALAAAALAAICALSGCTASNANAGPAPVASSDSAPPLFAPSPSASAAVPPGTPSVATLTAEVKRTRLPASTISGFQQVQTDTPTALLSICTNNGALSSDADIVDSASRSLNKFPRYQMLDFAAYAYRPDTGATVVDQARATVAGCTTYLDGNSYHENSHVVSAFPVKTPTGADRATGFCDDSTVVRPVAQAGQKFAECTAVLARGHVVVEVTVGNAVAATARKQLPAFVGPAAKALVAAVPAS